MKQHQPKKQPTRQVYASALKTIRAQLQTIESQSDTILRQNQFMVMTRMKDRRTEGPPGPGSLKFRGDCQTGGLTERGQLLLVQVQAGRNVQRSDAMKCTDTRETR